MVQQQKNSPWFSTGICLCRSFFQFSSRCDNPQPKLINSRGVISFVCIALFKVFLQQSAIVCVHGWRDSRGHPGPSACSWKVGWERLELAWRGKITSTPEQLIQYAAAWLLQQLGDVILSIFKPTLLCGQNLIGSQEYSLSPGCQCFSFFSFSPCSMKSWATINKSPVLPSSSHCLAISGETLRFTEGQMFRCEPEQPCFHLHHSSAGLILSRRGGEPAAWQLH